MATFLRRTLKNHEGNLFAIQTISLKLLFVLPIYEFNRKEQNCIQYWLNRILFHTMSWFTMLLPLHMALLVSKTIYDMDNGNLQVLSAYAMEAVWFLFSFVGIVYFNIRRNRLQHLMDFCNKHFKWRSAKGNIYVDMSKSHNLAKWGTITWTSVTAFSVWYSTIDPLLKGERQLSVDCWYPVDKTDNLNFTIIFLLQMWAKLVMVVSFASGSSLYVTLIIYSCNQYDGLFCSLKNIFYTCGIFRTRNACSPDGNDGNFSKYLNCTEINESFVDKNNLNADKNYNNNNRTSLEPQLLQMTSHSSLNAALDRTLFSNNIEHNISTRQQTEIADTNAGVGVIGGIDASGDVTVTDVPTSHAIMAATDTLNADDDNEISLIAYIEDFRAALKSCVDQHNSIMHVCSLMENFFHPFAFLRLAEMTLQLGFLAYVIAFTEVPTSSYLTLLTFLLFTLIDLYFLTYPAEYLRHQSLSVGGALMRAPWHLMMRYFKNDFLIMLTFAARPVKLTALRIFILNADRLRVVVGTAFSYFTLLSSFN